MSKTPLVVILAGGEGKRFAPLATDKTLWPFFGKPLLQHQLEQLARVGAGEVLIATNETNDEWLKTLTIPNLTINTKRQDKPLGMADALLHLEIEIGDHPILVTNAVDVVDDTLFTDIFKKIEQNQPSGLVTGIEMAEYFPGGYLETDRDRVISVIEKPGEGKQPSNLVNLVFHYFAQPTKFITHLKNAKSDEDDVYEVALSALMQEIEMGFVPYSGYWQKLKYPHFVLDMTDVFLHHRLQPQIATSAQVDETASIEGEVYLGENVQVQAGAVIKGPAYIGDNTIIGNNSLVRQSIIENNAIIGFGSEVARSYIGPECKLHHNFIGDSVLEADINPSYGTVTTNWRFDQGEISLKTTTDTLNTGRTKLGAIIARGTFSGANVTFLPGVTIGKNVIIYPGSIVHQALPANSTLKNYQEQEVTQ